MNPGIPSPRDASSKKLQSGKEGMKGWMVEPWGSDEIVWGPWGELLGGEGNTEGGALWGGGIGRGKLGFELAGICALELSSREVGDENPGRPEASLEQ